MKCNNNMIISFKSALKNPRAVRKMKNKMRKLKMIKNIAAVGRKKHAVRMIAQSGLWLKKRIKSLALLNKTCSEFDRGILNSFQGR